MSFEIPSNSKLTLSLLESISPESWNKTYSWTPFTQLQIANEQERAALLAVYPRAGLLTFQDRKTISEYIFWKKSQKDQTPSYMAIDVAYQKGYTVQYSAEKAVIASPAPEAVPASRVPLGERMLYANKQGERGVRSGSDVLAASIASMTRWTGKEVTFSMPVETIAKFKFVYVKPEGIRPFLVCIPRGPKDTGMKGRNWAYYLMAEFQKMSSSDYVELMSNWVQAMFNLPIPSSKVRLPSAFKDNVEIISFENAMWYKILYYKPAELGSFQNPYEVKKPYELMAQQLVEFAAARQGDASGISMLSQSVASWGLVSKAQAELEQTISLVVGMGKQRTVLTGYTVQEIDRIRAAVSVHDPQILVLAKVDPHQVADAKKQTSTVSGGLHIIRGNTIIDSTLVSTKFGKARSYSATEALSKMWDPVERACQADNTIYFGAGLPPENLIGINVFQAASSWASVFFFSKLPLIKKAQLTDQEGLVRKNFSPMPITQVYADIIHGMNTTVSSWIVPPINRLTVYSNLLVPLKITQKMLVKFCPNSDDFEVEYVDEDEIEDPDDDSSSVEDDAPASEGPETKSEEEKEKKEKKKEKEKDVPGTFVPSVVSVADI